MQIDAVLKSSVGNVMHISIGASPSRSTPYIEHVAQRISIFIQLHQMLSLHGNHITLYARVLKFFTCGKGSGESATLMVTVNFKWRQKDNVAFLNRRDSSIHTAMNDNFTVERKMSICLSDLSQMYIRSCSIHQQLQSLFYYLVHLFRPLSACTVSFIIWCSFFFRIYSFRAACQMRLIQNLPFFSTFKQSVSNVWSFSRQTYLYPPNEVGHSPLIALFDSVSTCTAPRRTPRHCLMYPSKIHTPPSRPCAPVLRQVLRKTWRHA